MIRINPKHITIDSNSMMLIYGTKREMMLVIVLCMLSLVNHIYWKITAFPYNPETSNHLRRATSNDADAAAVWAPYTTTSVSTTSTPSAPSLLVQTNKDATSNVSKQSKKQPEAFLARATNWKKVTAAVVVADANQTNNDSTSFRQHYENHPQPHALDARRTCLVHVGKTAGSLLSCIFKTRRSACTSSEAWERTVGQHSLLAQNVRRGQFLHLRGQFCDATKVDSFLVTTRNPIERFKSLFYYEKINRFPVVEEMKGATLEQRQTKFIAHLAKATIYLDCYADLEQLALEGLVPVRTIPSSIANMTCPQRAWAMVLGARRLGDHAWYNYEYYADVMRHKFPQPLPIMVMRNEHLAEDWDSIQEALLMAQPRRVQRRRQRQQRYDLNTTTTTFPRHESTVVDEEGAGLVVPGSLVFDQSVRIRASTKKNRQVALSPLALRHLCRALCYEIQYYKQFLQIAVNINATHYRTSLTELQSYCPDEPLHVRSCKGYKLPKFPHNSVDPAYFMGAGKLKSLHLWTT
ncbi:hypothetical protein ACA910_020084 [Epithemia clementina (nom. ined.)]